MRTVAAGVVLCAVWGVLCAVAWLAVLVSPVWSRLE